MIPFERSVASRRYRKVLMVMFAQGGKTDGLLDIIGQRISQSPCPTLYIGPNRQFLTEQFEPRLMALLDEAPVLAGKVARGKRMTKTRKVIGGVPLRLAHAGSATALKSDPIGLALTDEVDDLLANVKGQGDPIGLIDRRGDTFADFVHVMVSTPSVGSAEIEIDPVSKLEFWKVQDGTSLESAIWRGFQEGTRRHWTWACIHCRQWFVPRLKHLHYPEKGSPVDIKNSAAIVCPHCGGLIDDSHKSELNAKGLYVAPGQTINEDGKVEGELPEALTDSFWASGLANPFKTIGEQAAELAAAKAANTPDRLQTVLTGIFGELISPFEGGEGLTTQQVKDKALPYNKGEVPRDVLRVVAAADVQKRSIFYLIMGFGSRGACWVLDYGQLMGSTDHDKVWDDLASVLLEPIGGMFVELALVDSGFRPDKPEMGDVHRVYDFCRVRRPLVKPAKGWDSRSQPLIVKRIEVKPSGKQAPFSIELIHANSDFFKSMVNMRVKIPLGHRGGLHVPQDVTPDFCEGIASEVRTVENGKPKWREKHSHNHYLDCAALTQAAGYLLNVQRIPDGVLRDEGEDVTVEVPDVEVTDEVTVAPAVAARSLGLRERMAKRAQQFNR